MHLFLLCRVPSVCWCGFCPHSFTTEDVQVEDAQICLMRTQSGFSHWIGIIFSFFTVPFFCKPRNGDFDTKSGKKWVEMILLHLPYKQRGRHWHPNPGPIREGGQWLGQQCRHGQGLQQADERRCHNQAGIHLRGRGEIYFLSVLKYQNLPKVRK